MKPLVFLAFTLSVFLAALTASSQTPYYWDANDIAAGAGTTPTGTWGTDAFWNSASDGTGTPAAWVDGNIAVFSAGTDATGSYTVTMTNTQGAAGINFEEGTANLSGTGTINLSGSAIIDVAASASATINSVIGGSVFLTKNGSGTLTLTGSNTFSSGLTVNGGVLSFNGELSATAGSGNPLGAYPATATAGYLNLNAGATLRSTKAASVAGTGSYVLVNRGIAISGGVTLDMTDGTVDTSLLYSGIMTGSDGFTKVGAGTIVLGGLNTYGGDTTIREGGLGVNGTARLGDGTGTLIFAGGTLVFTANQTFANALPNPVRISTNATLRAYGSGFTSGQRQFRLGSANIVATNGTLTLDNRGTAGATLAAFQFNTMGGLQFTRPVVLGAGCRFDLWNDDVVNDAIFSGNISGAGNMQYTSSGTGTGGNTVVTGFNTYSGTNSLNGGYIGFGSDTLPASGTITSGPIGTGTLFVKWDPTLGVFAYGGPRTVRNPVTFITTDNFRITGTNALILSGAMTLGTVSNLVAVVSNTALTTFAGNIGGGTASKTFFKDGPGTLVLSGTNTYVNPTTVSAGTLIVNNGSGSGTGTAAVSVLAGATLAGNGRITGAVSSAGNISPGTSAGTLTLAGGLNLSSGGTYVWELATNSTSAGSFDQIAITGGTLVLGGSSSLSINFTNAATTPDLSNSFWQADHTWIVVAISGGSNPGSSNFGSLANANYPAGDFTTSVDGSGNVILKFTSNAPRVQNFGLSGGNFNLTWSTLNGRSYVVQYKTNLNSAAWIGAVTNTASGSTFSFTNAVGSDPQRFYRIVLLP